MAIQQVFFEKFTIESIDAIDGINNNLLYHSSTFSLYPATSFPRFRIIIPLV